MSARETHQLDQMFAAVAQMAAIAARYYSTLLAEGVGETQALALTAAFSGEMVRGSMRPQPEAPE